MQSILKNLIFILLTVGVVIPLQAQKARAQERNYQALSLEDCLAIARKENPVLAASREKVQELVADYQAARSQFSSPPHALVLFHPATL